jgi:hypothetical protein
MPFIKRLSPCGQSAKKPDIQLTSFTRLLNKVTEGRLTSCHHQSLTESHYPCLKKRYVGEVQELFKWHEQFQRNPMVHQFSSVGHT